MKTHKYSTSKQIGNLSLCLERSWVCISWISWPKTNVIVYSSFQGDFISFFPLFFVSSVPLIFQIRTTELAVFHQGTFFDMISTHRKVIPILGVTSQIMAPTQTCSTLRDYYFGLMKVPHKDQAICTSMKWTQANMWLTTGSLWWWSWSTKNSNHGIY